MQDIRGTIILADQVYQDQRTQKWIIAGTYTNYQTDKDVLVMPDFQFCLRLQLDRPGRYACRLSGADRMAAPHLPPIWETRFELQVATEQLPIFQTALTVPSPRINANVPRSQREPGKAYMLRNLITLTVNEQTVASCPLDFLFLGPGPRQQNKEAQE